MRYKYLLMTLIVGGRYCILSPPSLATECATLFEQAKQGSPAQAVSQLENLPAECDSLAVAVHKATNYLELAKVNRGGDQQRYAGLALSQLEAARAKQPDQQTALTIYGSMAQAHFLQGQRENTASLLDDCDAFAEQHKLPLPYWLSTFKKSFEVSLLTEPLSDEELVRQLTGKRYIPRPGKINVVVPFETDQAVLTAKGGMQVEKIAKIVDEPIKQGGKIMIAGHADKRGDAGHNLDLSKQRAKTILDVLQRRYPAQAALFQSEGYGESQLRYDGDTENDHALNRRVEIVLLD